MPAISQRVRHHVCEKHFVLLNSDGSCIECKREGKVAKNPNEERIVIVIEGGCVQNIMTDNPRSEVVCILVDYDNLKEGGQTYPPREWPPELNPEQVQLCATGEHPDIKKYLEENRAAQEEA